MPRRQIIIPAGETSKTVFLFASDDNIFGENDESLKLSMDTVYNGKISFNSEIPITIKDNDILPDVTLSVDGTEITEGGTEFSTVTATLSVATTQAVSVKLSTSGDDITSEDYRFSDDTLSITSGGLEHTTHLTVTQQISLVIVMTVQ